jgi:toxin-antitoxin system PIN domain toxin
VRLIDLNLLLYAVDSSSPRHAAAHAWVEEAFSGSDTVALSWSVLLGFIRLTTRPPIFERPLTPTRAFDLIDSWLALPAVTVIQPTDRHAAILRGLLEEAGTAGNLTTDAHLAALAIEHGAELCSTDTDFARFRGIRYTNPLAG